MHSHQNTHTFKKKHTQKREAQLLTVTDFPYVTYLACFSDGSPAGGTSEEQSTRSGFYS